MTATANFCSDDTPPPRRLQLQHLLDSHCEYEQRYRRLLQWRALGYAIMIYSVAKLVFLLSSSSGYHLYWYVAALIGIGMTLPVTLLCQLALRKIARERKELARELFSAGLRIDADYRLLTNTAHPRLVATSSRMADGQ